MKKNIGNPDQLTRLIKELRKAAELEPVPQRSPIEHLIYAFLAWNTTRNQADQAMGRLQRATVDLNDLRVSDPVDIVEMLGPRYAKADERAQRLVMVLTAIYRIEHAMQMTRIAAMPKREARSTLEEIEGMVPFVSASVLLLGLGAHAIPVDDQLLNRLRADSVVTEGATVEQAQAFIEHQVRADDALETHQLLRTYAERAVKVELAAPAKSTSKKSTKKTASKARTTKASGSKKKTTKKKSSSRS